MSSYQFFHPIEIRYGDLDPQGHVNNAKYLTYMEQARIQYIKNLGLWKSNSFLDVGIILAEVRVTYRIPIQYGTEIKVGVRVSRLGNKSMDMEYSLQDSANEQEMANGSSVLVAYDYRSQQTIPIPDEWREKIISFEGLGTHQNARIG
ncbi:MAG: acyl-CoA thioesterase [Anaerolineales bacterium]